MSRLEWNGPAVLEKVMQAAEGAVRETIDKASTQAASETWRSGIQYSSPEWGAAADTVTHHPRPVTREETIVRGLWGSLLWRYIFIEKGVAHMAGGHFLTRAADAEYPNLPTRIRERYG